MTDNLSESMLRAFEPSLVSIMAHHDNQPRTPQSSHNLQDERLFSLSGGIPPEYFDDLDFISMRRGWRIAAPAPSGDPWGYYVECGRSRHAGTVRSTQEASAQPHTESSTEAMDTDEDKEPQLDL